MAGNGRVIKLNVEAPIRFNSGPKVGIVSAKNKVHNKTPARKRTRLNPNSTNFHASMISLRKYI